MKNRLVQKKKGYVLPVVIIAVALIMLFSLTLLGVQGSEIKIRKATEDRVKVKYVAEAGIEAAISAITKSLQQGLNTNPIPSGGISVPVTVNTSYMNGQQYTVSKDKSGTALDSVVFNVTQVVNADKTVSYVISSGQNTKSFEVYSLGKLFDSSGNLIRNYGISAVITFNLDVSNKLILSYDILNWGDGLSSGGGVSTPPNVPAVTAVSAVTSNRQVVYKGWYSIWKVWEVSADVYINLSDSTNYFHGRVTGNGYGLPWDDAPGAITSTVSGTTSTGVPYNFQVAY